MAPCRATTTVRSRRRFLGTAIQAGTAVFAAPWLHRGDVAAAPARRAAGPVHDPTGFRVGYQIFGWGRYFPSAWWTGACAVGELGFRGIEGEYTIAELYEGREDEFVAGMDRCGVRLAALYSTTDLERPREQYENTRKNLHAARFCARMGARMIVMGGTEARRKAPEDHQRYAREANELGRRLLEAHGVRLGIHPHVGALIETRDEIARLMDATDPRWVLLAPDTGHLLAAGCDPVEVFETYQDRIGHVHLKDYAPPAQPGARGSFLPLGKGRIDFPALVRILAGTTFDGWLNVELDGGRGGDPAHVARDARDYVQGVLGLSLGAESAPTAARTR